MSSVTSRVGELLSTLAVVVGLIGWSLFWSNLVRVHYAQGDLGSALFTAAVFVGPGIFGLAWYVGDSLDVDIPSPSIDVDIGSS